MSDRKMIDPELFAKIMGIELAPDSTVVVHDNEIKYCEFLPDEEIGERYMPEGRNKFQFADMCKSLALVNQVSLRTCKLFTNGSVCWFNIPVKPWTEVQIRAEEEWMVSMLAVDWLDKNGYIKKWSF